MLVAYNLMRYRVNLLNFYWPSFI